MLLDLVREVANKEIAPVADIIDEREEFPWDIWRLLKEQGLTGVLIPEPYGGVGLDLLTFCQMAEEMSKVSMTSSGLFTAPALGYKPIMVAGTEEQKNHYLLPIASGEWICAFALTEPGSGSDATSLVSRAERVDGGYRINGVKRFISNADVADFIIVFAKTHPELGAKGITAFIVEKGTPGLSIPRKERKLGGEGIHACEVVFDDCVVPESARLGDEGEGFKIAKASLYEGRCIIGARATGLAQGALDYAVNYARERRQFGQPIGAFQGMQFMLADMATGVEASRQLVYEACRAVDEDRPRDEMARLTSMAKLLATDTAMKVTTDAVQVLGGYGYTKEYPVQRYMREAKLQQIVEGTNQIQRMLIGRSLLGDL